MKQLKPMSKIHWGELLQRTIIQVIVTIFLIAIALLLLLMILHSRFSHLFPQNLDLLGFQELQLIYSTVNAICPHQIIESNHRIDLNSFLALLPPKTLYSFPCIVKEKSFFF